MGARNPSQDPHTLQHRLELSLNGGAELVEALHAHPFDLTGRPGYTPPETVASGFSSLTGGEGFTAS